MTTTSNSSLNSASSTKNYYNCNNCNVLLLFTSDADQLHYKCPVCENNDFSKITQPFLLACSTCFEYWPVHVIELISPEGICYCPRSECNGTLVLKYSEEFVELDSSPNPLSQMIGNRMKNAVEFHKKLRLKTKIEHDKPIVKKQDESQQNEFFEKNELEEFLLRLATNFPFSYDNFDLSFSYNQLSRILVQFLRIQATSSPIIHQTVQNVTFIGNINGNSSNMLNIIFYIYKILQNYPNTHFVFLGGLFNHEMHDLFLLGYLGCLKLLFPDQISILHSQSDFPDQYLHKINEDELFSDFQKVSTNNSSIDKEGFSELFSLALGIMSYFSLFHISTMTQQNIRIFGSHTGFPYTKSPTKELNLDVLLRDVHLPITDWNVLPESIQSAFLTVPEIINDENFQKFNKQLYFQFLRENKLRYMVRSNNAQIPRFIYQDLICNIYSDDDPNMKNPAQIVRLKAGKSPDLITLGIALQQDLDKTYGIKI